MRQRERALGAVVSVMNTIDHLKDSGYPTIITICHELKLLSVYHELKLLKDAINNFDGSIKISSNTSAIDEFDGQIGETVGSLGEVLQRFLQKVKLVLDLLEDVLHRFLRDTKQEMEPLLDDVFHHIFHDERKEMDSLLRDVVHHSFLVHLSLLLKHSLPDAKRRMDLLLEAMLNRILEQEKEVDPFMKEIKDLRKEYIRESMKIGLSEQLKEISGQLLHGERDLKTMSLSGMAGIGKTHLARAIYQLPIIIESIQLRVWVTLGQDSDIENVIKDIARQIASQLGNQYMKDDKLSLKEHIYRNLFGRRYLIVLDNVWRCDDLKTLKMWFPKESGTGSRLLVTTRLEEVAKYDEKSILHPMRFLSQEESWNLFCWNVFDDGRCPAELEEAGTKIVEQCEGLPLLILEVAGILSGGDRDPDPGYWTEVANRQNTVFADAYGSISKVLLSSYEHLPQYLRKCFLYMVAFPQNHEIPTPKVIDLWIVEDFLEPNPSQTLQHFAEECLKKLVSQSLVIATRHSSDDTIKTSKLHSTYWHFCVVEAAKSQFLYVLNHYTDCFNESIESQCRLSVQNSVLFVLKEAYDSMAAALAARSLLCTGHDHQYPVPICSGMVSLEVLDALAIRFYELDEVLKLLRLKYLALTHDGNLPSLISKLRDLQSLIVRQHHNIKPIKGSDSNSLPEEIWDMEELRLLRITGSNLPDPGNDAQLPNLLTLHVKGQSCTEKVFQRIRKLKKLGIKIEIQPRSAEILNCFEHISILKELESLKCVVVNPRLNYMVVAPPVYFPTTLKKLSLSGLEYPWHHISVIGSLRKLEVLKLRCSAFRGQEWETKDEEFLELKYLLLEDIDLEDWTTEGGDCFQSLQHLIIRHCYKLKEIPEEVGARSTLERIEIFDCNTSIEASARQIEVDERDNGNESLQVLISSLWEI